jgi:colanic acid/amylovoran biosynthesis protein
VDAYILIGGSMFIERANDNARRQIKEEMLLHVFRYKPKFVIGANFGPYTSLKYKDFYTSFFSEFTDVCFRDKESFEIFKSQLHNVRYEADIVFALDYKIEKREPCVTIQNVGFSVMVISRLIDGKDYAVSYYNFILMLAQHYLGNGYNVYFFSFCKENGDESIANDLISKILAANFSAEKLHKIDYDGNIDKFLRVYSAMHITYVTRFHAMVLSLMYKQKVCPIIYSSKMLNVLNDIHFDGVTIPLSNISRCRIDNIYKQINTFVSKDYFLYESAYKQFDGLNNYLENGK